MAEDGPVVLDRLLTAPELADLLSVPITTLYFWRSVGQGPHGFRVGKQLRYRAADVGEWLDKQSADHAWPDSQTPLRVRVDELSRDPGGGEEEVD